MKLVLIVLCDRL